MRSIWSGSIEFGLVNIPVKLYSATEESELNFHLLDRKDNANIRYRRVNEDTGKEVDWKNIVRAYQFDGKKIILEDKDFDNASAKKSRVIEIDSFVLENEIDTIYYETPYYLEPAETGIHAYGVLREALRESKKVGIANFVLRKKEHLSILKIKDNILVLNKIRFGQEIRNPSELDIPAKSNIKPKELEMALLLIDQLTTKFDIKKYKDTYAGQLMKIIKAKAKGTKITPFKMKIVPTPREDLTKQLEKSLAAKKRAA